MPAHVVATSATELNKQGRYDRMTDDLFKLTGREADERWPADFVKLHAAESGFERRSLNVLPNGMPIGKDAFAIAQRLSKGSAFLSYQAPRSAI